jgi:hypothetical protein
LEALSATSRLRDFQSYLKRVEEGEEAMTSLVVIQEVVDWLEYNGRKDEVGVFLAAVNSYGRMRKVSNRWRDVPRASRSQKGGHRHLP